MKLMFPQLNCNLKMIHSFACWFTGSSIAWMTLHTGRSTAMTLKTLVNSDRFACVHGSYGLYRFLNFSFTWERALSLEAGVQVSPRVPLGNSLNHMEPRWLNCMLYGWVRYGVLSQIPAVANTSKWSGPWLKKIRSRGLFCFSLNSGLRKTRM